MKTLYYTSLFAILLFATTSCFNKGEKHIPVEENPVIIHDTITVYEDMDGNTITDQQAQKELERLGLDGSRGQNVQVSNTGDIQRLNKFSVIVATLAEEKGVDKLKKTFEKAGVYHFVVKNPSNRYYFVVHSSDSEQEAIRARAEFILDNAKDKSRAEIWQQHHIFVIDAFILEKK